ncbi:hypothetical protein QQY24_04140 [Streptomyces sp. TG1A-8]|uniref:hypothetical protein n=1 Tax=Streptomyces sp. TG1A-8 TaxID=3051385 RepID=UPI00265C476D|nr:hypothetical protein [Streptomyces sp. TG1A-8]MDO0924645.1 hypothetical protein [Streptomyces sp. TG1A-8]
MSGEAPPAYVATSDVQWTNRAYRMLLDRRPTVSRRGGDGVPGLVVSGPCPRCEHHLVDRRVLLALTGLGATRGGSAGAPETVVLDVTCGCGSTHQDAPEGVTGCGASFRIELELP